MNAESTHQHAATKSKKDLQAFLGIINYLGKFSPRTADVCESLRKLTSAKAEWMRNATYQKKFEEAKAIIEEDACMKFYDETKQLYIEERCIWDWTGSCFTAN